MSSPWWVGDGNRRGACGGDVRLHGRRRGRCQGGEDHWEAMMALSPIPFCPCDGHQTGLWYLPARWRDTTGMSRRLEGHDRGRPLLTWGADACCPEDRVELRRGLLRL